MLRAAVIVLLIALLPAHAQAETRIALLIGNQGYADSVGPLKNPANDVALVGRALEQVGFTVLAPRRDASRDKMLFGVYELAEALRKAGPGALGFLYYSGHGVAAGGENVLIPTTVESTSDAELSVRGVKLAEVVDILKNNAPDAVFFVVLDACRSNIRGQRGSKGFLPITDQRTGVVLAFSTAAGETASDEGTGSGPYAAALADEIVKPDRNDQAVFNAVRARVSSLTNRRQTPWTHDGLIGERIVFMAESPRLPTPTATVPSTIPQSHLSEAAEAWDRTKDATSIAVLELFIDRYKDTFYAELARAWIEELKKRQVVQSMPPPASNPVKPPVPMTDQASFGSSSKKELLEQTKPTDNQAAAQEGCGRIVGKWAWRSGLRFNVIFRADGSGTADNGLSVKWTCSKGRYTISWSNGFTDHMTLSRDGKRLDGTGRLGDSIYAIR